MLRSELLCFTLTSVFLLSSARVESERIEKNWAEEEPFRIFISWYLRHAYSVHVQVVHRPDSDLMRHHFAQLVQVVHENSYSAVIVRHNFIEPKGFRRSRELHETSSSTRSNDRAASSQLRSDRPPDALGDVMWILLIPDEAALREFLESIAPWRRRLLKSSLIIVIPTSASDTLCHEVSVTEGWMISAERMLKRIWTEDKVLNRFLSFPTMPCIKESLFIWNPFLSGVNGVPGILKRLKITTNDPTVKDALSEFVITVTNMNGYPFRAVIFERKPTVILKSEESQVLNIDQIAGLDGFVLKTITSRMNCTVELLPPSNYMDYGYRIKNGTHVGMVGDVVYRRVDFAANDVFIKDYETDTAIEFTTTVGSDSLCVVVPRTSLIPQWLQILQCFSPRLWYLLFASITCVGILRYIICRLIRKRRTPPNRVTMAIEIILMLTNSPQIMPRGNSERILVGFYLMFGVIIIGTFQGTLYENFTKPRHFKELSTLADVDKSGLLIGTLSPNLLNVFGEDEDEGSQTLRNLRQKIKILEKDEDVDAIGRTAWKNDIASIERKNDLSLTMKTEFLDEHGQQVLHVVEECPRTYQLAYMVPSGAFFLNRVNLLLRRMVESGLTDHWYSSTIELLIMKSSFARAKTIKLRDKATPFNLENIQTSFVILSVGLLLSLLVFIGENINFRYKIKLRPPLAITVRRNDVR